MYKAQVLTEGDDGFYPSAMSLTEPSERDTKECGATHIAGWVCTREKGHEHTHAAHGGRHQFATWDNKEDNVQS